MLKIYRLWTSLFEIKRYSWFTEFLDQTETIVFFHEKSIENFEQVNVDYRDHSIIVIVKVLHLLKKSSKTQYQ